MVTDLGTHVGTVTSLFIGMGTWCGYASGANVFRDVGVMVEAVAIVWGLVKL